MSCIHVHALHTCVQYSSVKYKVIFEIVIKWFDYSIDTNFVYSNLNKTREQHYNDYKSYKQDLILNT